ncbi:MAG: hypothetical protein RLY78_2509 [Pseudomonadota bacterium]|jgi:glutathione S-transferase|uniref:Glutathione S-transferase family protein n=1 Tax=Pseudaquabacterium rugosum TaxID=2984194 RepID=A0ABU9BEQ7_9BURK
MSDPARHVVLHYAMPSRACGVRMLLEELRADYALSVMDLKAGEQLRPAFLALNPLGKVPTLQHGEVIVTEQPAIYLYLAELYGECGLSPRVGDPLRGAYLRWMVFYGSAFEPALIDKVQGRDPGRRTASPYGDHERVIEAVRAQLARGPWMLGERYTAVDVLWGSALGWTRRFGMLPALPEIDDYVTRFESRPAVQHARTLDAALMAA